MKCKNYICVLILIILNLKVLSQITQAKITFERKTNLFKKFKDDRMREWMKEENKIKIDEFELFVTDTACAFKPVESDVREQMDWATQKNTVFQNNKTNTKYVVKNMWGDELHLQDSLKKRTWKITDGIRKIAGYNCRKAVWQVNDTMRIYAWFSYDLSPSFGPETFNGLPGTILGLATEDGGVIYFAKKVELIQIPVNTFNMPKKKKVQSVKEISVQMEKQYGKEKWFKGVLFEAFEVW